MAAIERKINGTFAPVPGGYAQQINEQTTLFVPEFTVCDFSASLSYYGKHYYLRPLRDDLPQLRGRGISYDEQRSTYTVTRRAYDKLKEQYRMSFETCLD